jgi:citrate synthase
MDRLKEKFAEKALPLAEEIKTMIKDHGHVVLGSYTIEQVYHGMKGMIGMVTETSKLDSDEGIRFRGYSIPELREKLAERFRRREFAGGDFLFTAYR